jgi:hypothetical protein
MNDLIHRYLDGELSDDEARALREAIASDPQVNAELRGWERMLGAAAEAGSGAPSAEFTDRVMNSVVGRRRGFGLQGLRPLFDVPWPARLAWAATLVVTFGLGALLTGGRLSPRSPTMTPAVTETAAGQAVTPALLPDQDEMRVVRLVYEPRDSRVRTVRVAGTFNDWNPEGIALERKGNLWTAVLILPRGTYEYMYVEDDARWVTDPLALETRDDGFGRKNAVLDLAL